MFKGRKLGEYLEREAMSYQTFGERIGVTRQMVMYLVRGFKQPSAATLHQIAREMGCSMDDLME